MTRVRSTALASLVWLLVVAALLYGLDRFARVASQHVVAGRVERSVTVDGGTEVDVHGGLYLPQLLAGRYDRVDVTLHGVRTSGPRLATLRAELYGVRLPFGALVTGRVSAVRVAAVRSRTELSFRDVNRYLQQQQRPVRIASAGKGELRVSGRLNLLGRTVDVEAGARVEPGEDSLRVTPTRLLTGASGVDQVSEALLGQRLTVEIPMGALPFGQHVTRVVVHSKGFVVRTAGSAVQLGTG